MGWGLKKGSKQGEGVISFAWKTFIPVVTATGACRELKRIGVLFLAEVSVLGGGSDKKKRGEKKKYIKGKKKKSISGSYFLPQAHMEVIKHKGGSWGQ